MLKTKLEGVEYKATCDNPRCNEEETIYAVNWHEALSKMKRENGWLVNRINERWIHSCDKGCMEEMK